MDLTYEVEMYGADPVLGPSSLYAYVESYRGDGWYIFEPSGVAIPMGPVRFGTGRDAADVTFASIFREVRSIAPTIRARAVFDDTLDATLPVIRGALSPRIAATRGHQVMPMS